jgi:hypothetical protein
MEPILITEPDEYKLCISRGFNPLLSKDFKMEIGLRADVQREFFGHSLLGRGNIPQANDRFYRWMWDNKKHYCEECMKPLENYWSGFISHILTRGANPAIAHDPRNINILCHVHHTQWETGERKTMRIYPGNIKTIKLLQSEYQQLNRHADKRKYG